MTQLVVRAHRACTPWIDTGNPVPTNQHVPHSISTSIADEPSAVGRVGTEHGLESGDTSSGSRPVWRSAPVRLDAAVDGQLHKLRHPRAVRTVEWVSHLGDGGAVWLAILAVLARRDPRAALRAAVLLGVGTVLVNGPVKRLTNRERPAPLDDGAYRPKGSSFPSGHSFSSWLMVALLPSSPALRVGAATVASSIASSRVFLRYHHATDVLAGSVIGATAGLLLRRVVRWR